MRKCLSIVALALWSLASTSRAEEWSIPLAGNVFKTAPEPGREGFQRNGGISWSDPDSVYSVFFHGDQSAELELRLSTIESEATSRLKVSANGEEFFVMIGEKGPREIRIGRIRVDAPGYVRVDIQGASRDGANYGTFDALVVRSKTEELSLDYVRNNKGNMFYWGRRGPSAHLRYEVPANRDIQYAYNEIQVPKGEDPIGSYFMANGFAEGYFGIQVNGPTERRVLFSVWSPFKTDNPRDIPEDQRIKTLGRGANVHIGEFGNEGSGGQSYLIYPWEAGRTYRFLTEVRPDGDDHTAYTCWFGDKEANEWRLIASFRRPKTNTYLKGFHSFIESFSPSHGYIGRRARYGNTWVHDTNGQWSECVNARFSVDATGRGGHRLDFQGGVVGSAFFLRNCGFFNETGNPGATFTRDSTENERPRIDFDALPR